MAGSFKRLVDYSLNPIELELDYFGVHIESNLREIKRKYSALVSSINGQMEKHDKLLGEILKIENSPRTRYNRLLKKPNKTEEEHEQLFHSIADLDENYNDLFRLERQIRDGLRFKRAKYPTELISFVYEELGEEMPKEDF